MQKSHAEPRVSREAGESVYMYIAIATGIGEFSHAWEGSCTAKTIFFF